MIEKLVMVYQKNESETIMPIDEIAAALESVESTGSFYAHQSISTTNVEIKFNNIGVLQFPLQEDQIKALIRLALPAKFGWKDQTLFDPAVRNVWEISKNKIKIGKKHWAPKLQQLLEQFKVKLGLPQKSQLRAELHNLLIYEPGHFFKPHQDTEKVDGMVATLVMILPTLYEGGELIIEHQGTQKTYRHPASSTHTLSCIAFYSDCYHEVKEVKSGYRVSLTYNLILEKYQGNIELLFNSDFANKLEKALVNHFLEKEDSKVQPSIRPPKLVYLLEHQYTQHSLAWEGLKNIDQVRVNALCKMADQLNLTAHLALADLQETWDCEFDYDDYAYRRNRGYRDYEEEEEEEEGTPIALMDTNLILRHWLDRHGKIAEHPDFTPNTNDVCWTGTNKALEPYQSAYEPWMGNYGNTLDRWYHRAAIIVWREEDYYSILFEIDRDNFVKEIFRLAQSTEDLTKLREMLRPVAHSWKQARGEHSADDRNTLELAFAVNSLEISQDLLTAYPLSIFNPKNKVLWGQLIARYGSSWFIELITAITANEKSIQGSAVMVDFSAWIQSLLLQSTDQKIIDWLLHYQWGALKIKHQGLLKTPYAFKTQATIPSMEMIDFIRGTLYAKDRTAHLHALDYLMENATIYPALPCVDLFEIGAKHLKPSEIESYGYSRLWVYLMEALTREYHQGLRDPEDWSITIKSHCSCSNCNLLNLFLNQQDAQQKIWPLVEEQRSHISREVMRLGIPVVCKIEQTGRPYKLILTKTTELYTTAKNRYQAIEQALKKLNHWAHHTANANSG
jgi:hypothetical protein